MLALEFNPKHKILIFNLRVLQCDVTTLELSGWREMVAQNEKNGHENALGSSSKIIMLMLYTYTCNMPYYVLEIVILISQRPKDITY